MICFASMPKFHLFQLIWFCALINETGFALILLESFKFVELNINRFQFLTIGICIVESIYIFVVCVVLDYEYSLLGLAEGSSERAKVKHEVHLRSAQKLQELCFKNGGIYIKLGQHIGQLVCKAFSSFCSIECLKL